SRSGITSHGSERRDGPSSVGLRWAARPASARIYMPSPSRRSAEEMTKRWSVTGPRRDQMSSRAGIFAPSSSSDQVVREPIPDLLVVPARTIRLLFVGCLRLSLRLWYFGWKTAGYR